MVFLKYPTFPSDAVLALATANARLQLCDSYGQVSSMDMQGFLSTTLEDFQSKGLMITALVIADTCAVAAPAASGTQNQNRAGAAVVSPPLGCGNEFITETFKVAQRARNAHAHVNAGFQFEIEQPKHSYVNPHTGARASSGPPTCRGARTVFGGVSSKTFIAYRCQNALYNAPLTSDTLSRALVALQLDLLSTGKNTEILGDQRFRESVMQSCLYRALLRCYPVFALPSQLVSAVQPWVMPISRGVELFVPPHGAEARSSEDPVGFPVRKLEAKIQATGEATYPSDETMPPQGLFGAIVFSTKCARKLLGLDCSAALALPGVVSGCLHLRRFSISFVD